MRMYLNSKELGEICEGAESGSKAAGRRRNERGCSQPMIAGNFQMLNII